MNKALLWIERIAKFIVILWLIENDLLVFNFVVGFFSPDVSSGINSFLDTIDKSTGFALSNSTPLAILVIVVATVRRKILKKISNQEVMALDRIDKALNISLLVTLILAIPLFLTFILIMSTMPNGG